MVLVCTRGVDRLFFSFFFSVVEILIQVGWSGAPIIGFADWTAVVVVVIIRGGVAADSGTVVCFGTEGTFNSVLGMLLRWDVLLQWVVLNSGRVAANEFLLDISTDILFYCGSPLSPIL